MLMHKFKAFKSSIFVAFQMLHKIKLSSTLDVFYLNLQKAYNIISAVVSCCWEEKNGALYVVDKKFALCFLYVIIQESFTFV